MTTNKPTWETPKLTEYGTAQELTLGETKTKTYGDGDDVILTIPDAPSIGPVS